MEHKKTTINNNHYYKSNDYVHMHMMIKKTIMRINAIRRVLSFRAEEEVREVRGTELEFVY